MSVHVAIVPVSTSRPWLARVATAVPVLFLLFDATIKLLDLAPVEVSFARLGYPASVARGIGLLELVCLAVYVVPRTSALGAVLLTGFLGGATATHVRVGDPLLTHVLFPSYVGLWLWGGLVLRDEAVRALLARTWRGRPRPVGRRTAPAGTPAGPIPPVDLAEARSTGE